MRYLVPMILLMACAPSEDKFEAETIAITCEKTFECTAEEDIAAAQDMGFWPLGSDAAECVEILTEASEEEKQIQEQRQLTRPMVSSKDVVPGGDAAGLDPLNIDFSDRLERLGIE